MAALGGVAAHEASHPSGTCPFHGQTSTFSNWLDSGLLCSAGKREFNLDRYHVAPVGGGADFAHELEHFRREVIEFRKVGFLAICSQDTSAFKMAEDELWLLGQIMRDAGLTPSVAGLISGETIAIPFEITCPVTGEETVYEFFPVAFCRNSGNSQDPLYDPSLSAPFTAINTTSDAFAFAMLVRDQSIRAYGCAPHELRDKADVEMLFRKCVTVWQNMSINTLTSYSRVAVDPSRAVHISEDHKRWIAPHNDPVFAELKKCPYFHEMPIVYASRLCSKWMATMFEGEEYVPGRDGQSGGTAVFDVEGVPEDLYQF